MQELFIPLTKIDAERRIIVGRAVQEVPDKTGEILDYETSVPEFKKWSAMFEGMSGGLSKGNIRVMHNPKSAAGKVTDIMYNDAEKAIDICAKIVDANEWQKVLEGVYTGFSVGGGYARKWKDEESGLVRYTARPAEISLVDNPCIPTAKFAELHKADGSTELIKLHGRARSFADIYREPPRSFRQVMLAKRAEDAAQPRSFGQLYKRERGEVSEARAMAAGVASGVMHGLGASAAGPIAGILGTDRGYVHGYQASKWRQANPDFVRPDRITESEAQQGVRPGILSTISGTLGGAALAGGTVGQAALLASRKLPKISRKLAGLTAAASLAGAYGGFKHGRGLYRDSMRYEAAQRAGEPHGQDLSDAELEQRRAAGRASAEKRRKAQDAA